MKTSTLFLASAAAPVFAHPGMDRVVAEIQARDDFILESRSTSLLGDLLSGILTPIGQLISDILQLTTSPIAADPSGSYKPPGALGSNACTKDPLCVWSYVANDMWSSFTDASGCTNSARGAIRLGFHDAGAWDKDSAYGGADGSILLTDELSRSDNHGLEEIGALTKKYYTTYHPYGAGMADIIQLGAIVATVACPGGPRIRAFAGRKDNARAAPTGKLPLPAQDAPALIELFQKKTFTASDLVALLGAHSTAKQRFVDPSRAGAALDSTPGVWDTKFYGETLAGDNATVFILHSDKALSGYAATKAQWKLFAGALGQAAWNPVSTHSPT